MYMYAITSQPFPPHSLLLPFFIICFLSLGLPCLAHVFYLVNYYSADITLPNDSGLTPVHIAAKIGDEKMTEVLICVFGAGVNSTDMTNKWTPLHFAARYNCPKLIE